MFPMHGGFMGRKGVSGFRFLHDEISGGLFALSHLQCGSAYTGDSIRVGATDYGFINNIVDLAQINTNNPINAVAFPYYDQVGANDMGFSGIAPFYDKAANEFPNCSNAVYLNNAVVGALSSLKSNNAFTSVHVIKHNSGIYNTQEWFMSAEGTSQFRMMWQSNNLRLNINGGVSMLADVAGINDANIKLIIMTYDGSLNSSGMNIYHNNMNTPITAAKSGSGGSGSNFFGQLSVSGRANNGVGRYNGFIYETHIFNKVLDATERQTVKDILSQYYTFI